MESSFRDTPERLKVIETLRLTPSGAIREEAHLARAARTCAALDFPFDVSAARQKLAAQIGSADLRARLTVDVSGRIEVATAPIGPPALFWRVAICDRSIRSDDPWRRIKTTNRAIYDDARAEMRTGLDELIFLNERGEVAEGGITNLFLVRGERLLTPPVSSGALPGILRAELLKQGRAVESRLTPADLAAGDLLMGNALRGLIPARLMQ